MSKHKTNNRYSQKILPVIIVLFAVMLIETIAVYFIYRNSLALLINVASMLLIALLVIVCSKRLSTYIFNFYDDITKRMTTPNSDVLRNFGLPILILNGDEIVWYNKRFRINVLKGNDIFGTCPEELINESVKSSLHLSEKAEIWVDNRSYSIFKSIYESNGIEYSVLYFVDDTSLKKVADEFSKSRPVVVVTSIDSFDELTADLPESEQAAIRVSIEKELEAFTAETTGFLRKLNNHRYLLIMDENSFNLIRAKKFDILDKVRSLKLKEDRNATLSIGVGRGASTFKECESMAWQALEMAQGRGGDQAAVKNVSGFEFFGGISSKGVEKRTKVKTRVIAAALKELIRGSDNVFIMGHKFGDLDSLGASFGLWKAVRYFGVKGHIVLDREKSLAKQLIDRIETQYKDGIIMGCQKAVSLVTKRSLVIVVDTHRADLVECPDMISVCPTKVIVDHHRKTVDYIENAVIFYHEPYASSACEMVCELLQYMGEGIIEKAEADALLAGIMLDTRNFVLRTGVRTFEASAYLRGKGADPVEVKKMFADSMEVYRERSAIVSAAKIYGKCAVAIDDLPGGGSRIAASQAADELLNIENVDASFVIYESNNSCLLYTSCKNSKRRVAF